MNPVIEEIASEAAKLDDLEQRILLTRLKVKNLKLGGITPAANPPTDIQPLTMEEIDFYKHEARKQHANKQICS